MHQKEEPMKQTVAVIGADERMGSAITLGLARAGYRTLVASHDRKDLSPLVGKLPLLIGRIGFEAPQADVGIAFRARDASWEADIIIPVVPYEAQAVLASEIKDVVTGKIVISVVNPLNKSSDGLLTPCTTSAAEELAGLLPRSAVVKAFNTLSPADFETSPVTGGEIADVFVAGDEDDAVSTVMQLVNDAGFHPVFAGKLTMSRTLESMMLLVASLSIGNHTGPVGWKVVHRVPSIGTTGARGLYELPKKL
jgi:predicted dinucleotide-binding enzyme